MVFEPNCSVQIEHFGRVGEDKTVFGRVFWFRYTYKLEIQQQSTGSKSVNDKTGISSNSEINNYHIYVLSM